MVPEVEKVISAGSLSSQVRLSLSYEMMKAHPSPVEENVDAGVHWNRQLRSCTLEMQAGLAYSCASAHSIQAIKDDPTRYIQ